MLAAAACLIPDADLSAKACPCASPLVCDSARNRCVSALGDASDATNDGPSSDGSPDGGAADAECDAGTGDPRYFDDAVQVSVGAANAACAVRANGTVACWGKNVDGVLGRASSDAGISSSAVPVLVPGVTDAVEVRVGGNFACVMSKAGTVRCWGGNESGQLGRPIVDGGQNSDLAPAPARTATGTLDTAVALGTGYGHACAVTRGGALACWGDDGWGVRSSVAAVPAGLGAGTKRVSVGAAHACVVRTTTADQVDCFGDTTFGQFGAVDGGGTGPTAPLTLPLASVGVVPAQVHAGTWGTCVIDATGNAYCMGANYTQQFGAFGNVLAVPTSVPGLDDRTVVELGVSSFATCARRSDGTVSCLGRDAAGLLGRGGTTDGGRSSTPSPVVAIGEPDAASSPSSRLTGVISISLGGAPSVSTPPPQLACAVAEARCGVVGSVVCWGSNADGRLGTGDVLRPDSAYPLRVVAPVP